ncbi:diadenosine tetraphosphate (Ap4A) HIT family hydrolase [Curtobacterium sp. JUb34]|nr:diadenosine tetraphosphate (Ap4A) HIT family hydrolase [Curtobacterium sp. JUb34]
MGNMTTTSVFEQVPPAQWVADDEFVFAILDAHPVSPGHTLVIPKRRITSWFDATGGELAAMTRMVALLKARLDEQHHPDGYNVGFNDGSSAGQTVFHAHLHVIPRFAGDVPAPAGGVRHAVIGRGHY